MEIRSYITESSAKDWCGCLMLSLPQEDAKLIKEWAKNNIPEDMLADDGREDYTHCTVLYGFPQTVQLNDVKEFLETEFRFSEKTHTMIELGKIKRFSASEFRPNSDVLVIEVKEFIFLNKLHVELKDRFSVVTNYPTYNPHITIAYIKPNELKHLDDNATFDSMQSTCDEFVYSRGSSENRSQSKISYNDFAKKTNRGDGN